MRRWRTAAKVAALAVLAFVAVLTAALVALQTRPVQSWLVTAINRSLSGRAQLSAFSGTIPTDMRAGRIELFDPAGRWAVVHDAHLKIDPAALLRGRIGIDLLSSREIRVERRPQSSGSSSNGSLALPIELRHLDLGAIYLAPPVLGQEIVLSVSGSAKLLPGQTEAHLDLHRLDSGPGRFDAQLDLSGQPARLRLAMNVDDPSGSLLDTLLARDDHLPSSARLNGDGLVADWHGRLDADAGGTTRIGADISLSESDGYRAAVEGRAEIAALLPPSIRDLVGNATTFRLSGSRKPNGDIVADTLRLDLAAATLDGSAVVGAGADGTVKGDITVEAPQLATLSPLLGRTSGSAEFRLAVSGTKLRPAAQANLEAKALKLAGSGANNVVAHLEANPTGTLSDLHSRVNLSGKGEIRGIVASGAPLTSGDERLTWTLAGSAEPAKQAIAIDRLDVDAPGATLIARGNADKARKTLSGTVHLVATDLSLLSGLAGRTLSGHGAVDATVSHEASGASQLGVSGKLNDLTTGIPVMDELLGRRLDIDISARRLANGDLDVPKASINAANFHATGRTTLASDTNRATGAFAIDLPRLDALSTAERPISGHAHLDGTISGTAAAPQLTALLNAGAVSFGGSRLDRVTARLDANKDPDPKGSFDAEFQSGPLSGTLNGTFALSGNGKALDLSNVNFTAGGTTARMALHTALGTHLTSGKIDARSSDLSRLSNLVGLPLSGTMRLETKLTAERGQGATFSFSSANLSLGSDSKTRSAIEHITAEGQLSDVFGKPQGRAALNLQGATVANTTIHHVRGSLVSSRAGRFGFNADFAGRSNAAFEVSAAGIVDLAKDSVAARISKFEGKLGERAFRLDAPLRLAKSGGDISVSGLNLALGDGRVTGDAALKGDRVRATLKAQHVPLALAEAFAGKDTIAGTAGADLDIRGTVTHPAGRIAMTAQKLRLRGARADQPTVDITAAARLLPGRVALDGRISMAKGEALDIAGEVPIRIRRQPITAAIVRDRPIAMRINGNGRLENIADLLPIGEDKLAGSYRIDLRLSGTAASPNAEGQMTVRNGRYESFVYGTVLNGMTLDLAGNRDRIVLQRFSANDGDKGTLNIRGTSLLSATAPTLDVTVALRKFQFMRNDEAVGHGSGDLRIAGNMTEPRVTGGIRLDDAQLYLPDRLPPSVRKLDVTEINGATGDVLKKAAPPSSKQPVVATLDVTLDIPGQVFVRGRGLDSEWHGRFHVTGTSSAPQIEGGLQVVHGTMNFLGKTLTLSRGTITLVGGDKIEPMLDFLAESISANITAQVAVTGPVQQPKITLTSNPPLPQDQILAQLLFGRDVTQLSPLEGAQIAQAAAALASGGPSVIDRVRMKFGLDRLSIGSADQNTPGAGPSAPPPAGAGANASAGAGNTAVSAGKYVAPGTYLGVKQSASGESQAQVEVEITRHVEVGATAGASRGNSVGVQWKLDY